MNAPSLSLRFKFLLNLSGVTFYDLFLFFTCWKNLVEQNIFCLSRLKRFFLSVYWKKHVKIGWVIGYRESNVVEPHPLVPVVGKPPEQYSESAYQISLYLG